MRRLDSAPDDTMQISRVCQLRKRLTQQGRAAARRAAARHIVPRAESPEYPAHEDTGLGSDLPKKIVNFF